MICLYCTYPKSCVLQKQSNSQHAVDAACIREYLYNCPGANLSFLISDIKTNPPFFLLSPVCSNARKNTVLECKGEIALQRLLYWFLRN